MKLDQTAVNYLRGPINSVWFGIACELDGVSDNEEALELCLDANRLAIFGYPEADNVACQLFAENDIDEVYKFLAQHIHLV